MNAVSVCVAAVRHNRKNRPFYPPSSRQRGTMADKPNGLYTTKPNLMFIQQPKNIK